MAESKSPERLLLEELFNKASMNDLPAMSAHVQELISLCNNSRSTAAELTEAIQKDYSLTNKILQVANSAYYSRGVPISSISRAVTVIGFSMVRQLAMAIAIFEDLIKKSDDKDDLSGLMTKSFLSATQARLHAETGQLQVSSEDAFIGALLYNLGEIVALVYLPEYFYKFRELLRNGGQYNPAAKGVFNGLTCHQIGREIAHVWNFAPKIGKCMTLISAPINDNANPDADLINLALFCNMLTNAVSRCMPLVKIYSGFHKLLDIDRKTALQTFKRSIEAAEDTSETIRYGLHKLNIRDCIKRAK